MKRYMLIIENKNIKLWEQFKDVIQEDIGTEILKLIKQKVKEEYNEH